MSEVAQQSTISGLRAAMEAGDAAEALAAFAPDAVFRSPLTGRLEFRGPEQIAGITAAVLELFEGIDYTTELSDGTTGVLVGRTRVLGRELEFVDHLEFAPDGKIRRMTVFFRPMPAAAVALRAFGAALARPKSPARAALISLLARPLGLMAETGDGIGARIMRPVLPGDSAEASRRR